MRRIAAGLGLIGTLLGCGDRDPCRDLPWRASDKPPLALPAPAGGQLVAIWEWGEWIPFQSSALVVADRAGTRELPVARPLGAAWLTPGEILVTAGGSGPEHRLGVLRVAAAESAFERWTDDPAVQATTLSPDRRLVVGTRARDGEASDLLELRRAEPSLAIVATRETRGRPRAWSADGQRIALANLYDRRTGAARPQWIEIVSGDLAESRALELPFDGKDPQDVNALALAWPRAGLVARVEGWVALCDPDASTCRPLWKPEPPLFPVRAVALGEDALLVGLADAGGPLADTRIRELHQLDLATGRATRLLRTPERTYLADFDWIATPGAADP